MRLLTVANEVDDVLGVGRQLADNLDMFGVGVVRVTGNSITFLYVHPVTQDNGNKMITAKMFVRRMQHYTCEFLKTSYTYSRVQNSTYGY